MSKQITIYHYKRYHYKRLERLFFVGLLSLLFTAFTALSGCGFHLRGYDRVPSEMHALHLESSAPYNPLVVQLRNDLQSVGVNLVSDAKLAPVTLQVLNADFDKSLTNISANTLTRTYVLKATLVFQLKDTKGSVIFGPETISTTSSYITNSNQLLGDTQLLQIQRQQMQHALLFKLFNRLDSEQGRHALKKV